MPGSAGASLVHDIYECDDSSGATCDFLVGSIEFPTATGVDAAGIVLSYFGTFDETDIQSVSWTISPADWLLTTLDMALNNDPSCMSGAGPCTSTIVTFEVMATPGLAFTATQGLNCPAVGGCSMISAPGGTLFVPGAEVSEPTTLGLALSTIGLVVLRRKRWQDR